MTIEILPGVSGQIPLDLWRSSDLGEQVHVCLHFPNTG